MPARRRNGAAKGAADVAATGNAEPVENGTSMEVEDQIIPDSPLKLPAAIRREDQPRTPERPQETEAAPGPEGSPESVHNLLQQTLRSVSQEHDELYAMVRALDDGTPPSPAKEQLLEEAEEDEASQPKTFTARASRAFWRGHDSLEAWGYRHFPAITDLFNVAVYSIDLAVRSVKWFQFGVVAVVLGARLIVYSLILMPALLRIFFAYYADRRIHRRIRFGPAEREYLDIYVPKEAVLAQKGKEKPVPVVIAIMGGAFIIGHRGYNAQLGMRLMDFGVITVGIDYRNFPRAQIPDMVEDVGRGVRWVFQNIHIYGGDRNNVMLLGQSAGAHLSATLMLEHALLEAMEKAEDGAATPSLPRGGSTHGHDVDAWSVRELKGYLGISGLYDLVKLTPHLASRGVYPRIVDYLTNHDAAGCSPQRLLDTADWKAHSAELIKMLPPIYLLHGHRDRAVPVWSSSDFAEKLKSAGVGAVTCDLRRGMSHTYPVIEGPLQRKDPQVELILPVLFGEGAEKRLHDSPKLPKMWPSVLCDAATAICPF